MKKEEKPPYVPTRTRPHRWCGPLHLAPVPFGLAIMAFDLWHNLLFLVVVVVGAVGGVLVHKLVHFKPTPRSGPATVKDVVEDIKASPTEWDLSLEDVKYEGTGWRMLEVRKVWARVAVGCDLLLVGGTGCVSVVVFADPHAEAQRVDSADWGAESVLGMLVALAFMAFSVYAHKKSTQPRKPKRAWVPAFLRTNM